MGRLSNLLSLGLLLLGAAQPILGAKPSPGCGKANKLVTAAAATTPLTLTSGGKAREFYAKLPANYDSSHPYRLILTLHALGGNGKAVATGQGYLPWYGLPPLINDTTDAIYLSPTGLSNGIVGWWNSGGSDLTFLKELIKTVEDDLCIDQNLRFSTGFSHGAAMSFIVACGLGKEIRAVAVLSGNPQISGSCPGGTEPVAWYSEHGTKDQVLPIAGGRQMRDRFIKNNGCTAKEAKEPAKGEKHIKTVYEGCKEGYPVTFVAFDGYVAASGAESKTVASSRVLEANMRQ